MAAASKQKTVGIMGAGTMGGLLLRTLVRIKYPGAILVCDRNASTRGRLKRSLPRAVFTEDASRLAGVSVLFLAVKPQDFRVLKMRVSKSTLVVSIMAGVPIAAIKRQLGANKVIRAMPNTPAALAKGFTAWTATSGVSRAERASVQKVFQAMGQELYVASEDAINKFTAVSGSGPAYIFYTILCFMNAARSLGIPARDAERAVRQTLDGATALLALDGDITKRISQVASKGGTTEAALAAFKKSDMEKMWARAVRAAYRRAQVLARKSGK